ncbi:hypothetical protein N7456_005014 [Penicillium angulare]|uniref:Uncharacterized protein n=1 Tax=Penicillium angulare TaxID=116970 RepID=A0A9W9FXK4_9EURO|nr:hypothetical protein N7456_005014 [Penicillium angulare]
MLEKTDDDGLDVPEDSEWELVDVNDGSWDLDHGTSLHFDITLGWGQWKHTLCSVDYTNKVQLRDELDESEGNEADDESKSVTGSDSDDHPERRND